MLVDREKTREALTALERALRVQADALALLRDGPLGAPDGAERVDPGQTSISLPEGVSAAVSKDGAEILRSAAETTRDYRRLAESRTLIVNAFRDGREFTSADAAGVLGVSAERTRIILAELVGMGVLEADPWPGVRGRFTRYRYERPREPGAAAVADAERRRRLPRPEAVAAERERGGGVSASVRRVARKDVRELLAEIDGDAIVKFTRKHARVVTDSGTASVPLTPSDPRSLKNTRAQLRRIGAIRNGR